MPVTDAEKAAYVEKTTDIIKRHTRLEDEAAKRMRGLMTDLRRDVAVQITGEDDYTNLRLKGLQDSYGRLIDKFGADAQQLAKGAVGDSWAMGGDMVNQQLATIGMDGIHFSPSTAQAAVVLDFTSDLITGIENDIRKGVDTQVRLAVLGAKSPFQAMKDVTTVMGIPSRASDRAKGLTYRAEMIVRTETGRAFNMANQSSQEEAAKKIPGLRKEWLATADDRTRQSHLNAHGQVVDVDKPFNIGGYLMMYPNDPAGPASETINCRCTSVTLPPIEDDIQPEDLPLDDEVKQEQEKRREQAKKKQPTEKGRPTLQPPARTAKDAMDRILNNAYLELIADSKASGVSSSEYLASFNTPKGAGEPTLYNHYRDAGYNELPRTLPKAEFDALVKDGRPVIYRGLGGIATSGNKAQSKSHALAYMEGTHFAGLGVFGNGTYASTRLRTANAYAGQDGVIMKSTMSKNAQKIEQVAVYELQHKTHNRMKKLAEEARERGDSVEADKILAKVEATIEIGNFGTATGYDYMTLDPGAGGGELYYIIWNRGEVVVQDSLLDPFAQT
jgi:SPP1 gp7 family putative phage head morphogenesis protein